MLNIGKEFSFKHIRAFPNWKSVVFDNSSENLMELFQRLYKSEQAASNFPKLLRIVPNLCDILQRTIDILRKKFTRILRDTMQTTPKLKS